MRKSNERLPVTVRCPVRIDFAGGPTDVELFYTHDRGAVTSAAIQSWANVRVSQATEHNVELISHDLGCAEHIPLDRYPEMELEGPLKLLRAAVRKTPDITSLKVETSVDVPAGSGLGGSASLAVALLLAIDLFIHQEDNTDSLTTYSDTQLRSVAQDAVRLENVDLGNTGGFQDQYTAALGGFVAFEATALGIEAIALELSPDVIKHIESHSLLVYTGMSHISGDVHKQIWKEYEAGHPATTAALHDVRDTAQEIAHCLTQGEVDHFPTLIAHAYDCQKQLHPAVVPHDIQASISAYIDAGAQAGKLLGAGRGGTLYLYCPPEHQPKVQQLVTRYGYESRPVHFAHKGALYEFSSLN